MPSGVPVPAFSSSSLSSSANVLLPRIRRAWARYAGPTGSNRRGLRSGRAQSRPSCFNGEWLTCNLCSFAGVRLPAVWSNRSNVFGMDYCSRRHFQLLNANVAAVEEASRLFGCKFKKLVP